MRRFFPRKVVRFFFQVLSVLTIAGTYTGHQVSIPFIEMSDVIYVRYDNDVFFYADVYLPAKVIFSRHVGSN